MSLPRIKVENLSIGYDGFAVMKDISFEVGEGEVFVVMGASGCGKSTLLRTMIGLQPPLGGAIFYGEKDFNNAPAGEKLEMLRAFGVLYQGGALWSAMTIAENIALPMRQFTSLSENDIKELVELKLALVGLRGFGSFYPSEISGGMRKRAGLARAIALDPKILFFDEPSAGLDPISSRRLDELILEMRYSLGATIVVVTHELASIFTIADRAIYLDSKTRAPTAIGKPKELLKSGSPDVRMFLNRGVDTSSNNG
ncbi:MAG: ATP-binding cassette domain-containing protein [Opitutales bacterium]|nr:ATP-binding cassette domain-containing protein [Opitutales bacterium]